MTTVGAVSDGIQVHLKSLYTLQCENTPRREAFQDSRILSYNELAIIRTVS